MKRTHLEVANSPFEFPLWRESMRAESRNPDRIPALFPAQWDAVMGARSRQLAPVDTMGCERLFQQTASPANRRFQILVSLLLSPQSKDEKTKESMDNLFSLGGEISPQRIAALPTEQLEVLIRPSGLYRAKARALRETSAALVEQYGGDVPRTLAELLKLRGVGPKVGLLALSACWDINEGIGCDVHVTRISQRLGWAKGGADAKNGAETVRKELEEWLPTSLWRPINYSLVGFGQTLCTARFPKCHECPAAPVCPSAGKFAKPSTPSNQRKKKKTKTEEEPSVML